MAKSHPITHAVTENVARLLRTGDFSDLTLVCQEQRFDVHRAIICTRSPVWRAAAEGEFREASSKLVDVQVSDVPTLRRALNYLYIGEYDDENVSPVDASLRESDAQCASDRPSSEFEPAEKLAVDMGSRDTQPKSPIDELPEASQQSEPPPTPEFTLRPSQSDDSKSVKAEGGDDQHSDECQISQNGSNAVCTNMRLSANVQVYILADYYQIPELRQIAVSKFTPLLQHICIQGFADVCSLVYAEAPPTAHELRTCLGDAIACHGRQLMDDPGFLSVAMENPELLCEAFSKLIRLQQVTFNERDAAIAESLHAVHVAEEANRQGQQACERVITQVNQAHQCRHCGLDSNVFFEAESTHLGVTEYSLRCKCCTRY